MSLGGGSLEKDCKITIVVSQIVVALAVVAGCFPQFLQAASIDSSLVKELSPTIYFIKLMNKDSQKCDAKKTIFGIEQKPLLQVCAESYSRCVVEGTCALVDAEEISEENEWENSFSVHDLELINYVKLKNGIPLFEEVDSKRCPHGYGVRAICLDPFYTVAADLEFHSPGDVIFVPKAVGTLLANGERHNGYFIIRDKGGGIKGANRFDFFTGFLDYRHEENPFSKIGLNNKKVSIEYRKVVGNEADNIRRSRRYPLTPLSQF